MEERWGPGEGWVSDSIGKVSEESVGHLSEKHEVTIKQDRIESKYFTCLSRRGGDRGHWWAWVVGWIWLTHSSLCKEGSEEDDD